jgi:hypothetical protein
MNRLYFLSIMFFSVSMSLAHAQTCKSNMPLTKPDSQYEFLNKNTEVLDKKTGLIWQRCVLGMSWNGSTCAEAAKDYSWEDAGVQAVNAASITGEAWRLPSREELKSLVETACYGKAINETIFPETPSVIWSSSENASLNSFAWAVYFHFGFDYWRIKNDVLAVRLVRSQ